MGRRKKYMEDGDDSSDEEPGRIQFDATEEDYEEERQGFSGRRKRKMFDDESDDDMAPRGGLGSKSLSSERTLFHPAKTTETVKETTTAKKIPEKKSMSRAEPGFAGFSKHTTGFGQKMLQKMGWEIGKGLGSGGEGIINPVETKLRPKGMGMGFKGFDERTSQAKEEARKKRGSEDEDEESEEEHIKKAEKREAWKSEVKKVRKIKVVYKTAKDILSEMTVEKAPMGQQKIIDMTGPTVKEVSLSDLRTSDSPTFIETTTQLPELRHNLRLLVDLAQGDLENLSKEKQANTIQMKEIETELNKIQRKVDASTDKKTQIEEIKKLTEQLERISKDSLSTGAYAVGNITALFGEVFDVIEKKYMEQVKTLGLDSMVVASWAPILKYKCIDWDVLSDPTWGADDVKRWRKLLPSHDDRDEEAWYDEPVHKSKAPSMATPYDTMMNTIWLSKVRSAINHHWDVRQPEPLISLFEVWKAPLLPRFITENIIDQLLLPKIANAVSDWDPRNDPDMVHTWIHPWLPVLEAWRLADIFTTIRQKLSTILSQWHPSDESALHIITPWKDVWTPSQMETFLTRSILPKLTQVLRHEFVVNPRDQQIEPLVWCLAWKDTISVTILCQLLENEFFVKWLDVLYKWLTLDRDRVNYDQVREWYLWWKGVFVAYDLYSCKVIAQCFRKGLDMMFMAGNGQTVVRPSLI